MAENEAKHKIKDSVFTDLFQNKKYLLQLYKALHPEDQNVTEDELKDVTLKYVMVGADYNDLGFSVGDKLVILVESQSTWTFNIIIRALMYLVQTYHDYFKRTNQDLYGSKKVNLPKPELYVIYVGEQKKSGGEDIPDTISLRKAFFSGEKIAVDAEVKVIKQGHEENIIGQYIIFSKVYNEQRTLHGKTKKAVTETIRICKDRNILKEYLESREQEVVDMMMTLFDDEQIYKAHDKSVMRETDRATAERLIRKGKMTIEDIADCVQELSLDELKQMEAEIMQSI